MKTNTQVDPATLALPTRAIHGTHLGAFTAPVVLPIHQTSTYRFESSEGLVRFAEGDDSVYVYSRYHNPSVHEVEERIALLNRAEAAAMFSSGMAAITTAVLSAVKSGQQIVSTAALYGGTYRFFRDELPKFGIDTAFIETSELDKLPAVLSPRTALMYFESPTNPTLDIVDIRVVVQAVRDAERRFGTRIPIIMDNTFASIFNQDPFALGVDVIVESATKYLGGHHDLLAGVLSGPATFIKQAKQSAKYYGGCADPFAAFLLARSLKTFELRMRRHNENAMALAQALERNPRVNRVLYPGLPSHPRHATAKAQMSGSGGMVTIEVKPSGSLAPVDAAALVTERLQIAVNATSLGGVETLVCIPVYTSHINMSDEELRKHGVTPGMIRISTGVESADDLIRDFEQALECI